MSFEKRNYFVVGGRTGIGHTIRKKLAAGGANIWNVSRQPLNKSVSGQEKTCEMDITACTPEQIAEFLPETLHGLVYCPGTITLKPFQALKQEDFLSDLTVNLLGAVTVLQAAMKSLKAFGDASVVLFSTVATGVGMKYHASIASAKSAVEGLAISLASEWANSNIRVNVVAPSLTDTPLAQRLLADDQRRATAAERHPLRRVGTTDDMAAAALYLLGVESQWVSGQVLRVDGGLSILRPL